MTEPPSMDPAQAIRALGFDPEGVRAVILTPTSGPIAIAADYPEPYVMPTEEVSDARD